jgi:hypothetical protein
MNSTRTAITLGFDERYQVEPGVWENNIFEKKVKAQQERIYQRRLDTALQEGLKITARFKIRAFGLSDTLKYVKWKGSKYKVNSVNPDPVHHTAVIEIGELL